MLMKNKKYILYCVLYCLIIIIDCQYRYHSDHADDICTTSTVIETTTIICNEKRDDDCEAETTKKIESESKSIADRYSDSDINLIAKTCVAEAGNQSDYGKRLVIDCILNRIEDHRFPNSVKDVLYSPGQFSTVYNGQVDKIVAPNKIKKIVIDEIKNRTNHEVLYFNNIGYFSWATPVCHVEDHYFSK